MYLILIAALFLSCAVHGINALDRESALNVQEKDLCKGRELLPRVAFFKKCSEEIAVDEALIVFPSSHTFSVLPNCLKCNLTLRGPASKQLTATLYSLATETGPGAACDTNRLDIYDGSTIDKHHRLSNQTGICGCNVPTAAAFRSTENVMTLTFDTKCDNVTRHGKFDIVIAAVNNDAYNKTNCSGKFECLDGACLDKNLVCDGHRNCPNGSDETGCVARNETCPGQFECIKSSKCIDKNLVCNGRFDCPDHSDEVNCTARNGTCPGMFECKTGQCIDKNLVCNGKRNCADNSDEIHCKHNSRLILFILVGIGAFLALVFLVILIILCYKYCCLTGQMANVYRRMRY